MTQNSVTLCVFYISKIESGHFHPTDENPERVAKALNVEPYKLYMFNHQMDIKDLKQNIKKMPVKHQVKKLS